VKNTGQSYQVYFQMLEPPDKKLKPLMRSYISRYCRSQGYIMSGLTFAQGHLCFQIKLAPPREEKRPEPPKTSPQTPPSQ
jgi:hypothetical protein